MFLLCREIKNREALVRSGRKGKPAFYYYFIVSLYFNRKRMLAGMVACAVNPAFRRPRQEDHHRFEASLNYKARPCLKNPQLTTYGQRLKTSPRDQV